MEFYILKYFWSMIEKLKLQKKINAILQESYCFLTRFLLVKTVYFGLFFKHG